MRIYIHGLLTWALLNTPHSQWHLTFFAIVHRFGEREEVQLVSDSMFLLLTGMRLH